MMQRKRYLQKIEPFIHSDLMKALTGVRRCGKTILLEQIKTMLLEKGAGAEQFIQINFEKMATAIYPKHVVSSDIPDMSRNGIIHKNSIQFLQE